MTIQYQNTREEYLEATEALAARRAKKHRAPLWILAAAVTAYGIICGAIAAQSAPPITLQVWFDLLIPIIFFALINFFVALYKSAYSKVHGARLRAVIGLVLFFISIAWFIAALMTSGPGNSNSRLHLSWLVPHIGWLFLLTSLSIFNFVWQRAQKTGSWESEPSFHRAKSAEISAEGVLVTDVVTRNEMRWGSFVGWTETKTLIVLFSSDYRAIFFPKHAFNSPEELAGMRVLASTIPSALSSAFPVVPAENPPASQIPAARTHESLRASGITGDPLK